MLAGLQLKQHASKYETYILPPYNPVFSIDSGRDNIISPPLKFKDILQDYENIVDKLTVAKVHPNCKVSLNSRFKTVVDTKNKTESSSHVYDSKSSLHSVVSLDWDAKDRNDYVFKTRSLPRRTKVSSEKSKLYRTHSHSGFVNAFIKDPNPKHFHLPKSKSCGAINNNLLWELSRECTQQFSSNNSDINNIPEDGLQNSVKLVNVCLKVVESKQNFQMTFIDSQEYIEDSYISTDTTTVSTDETDNDKVECNSIVKLDEADAICEKHEPIFSKDFCSDIDFSESTMHFEEIDFELGYYKSPVKDLIDKDIRNYIVPIQLYDDNSASDIVSPKQSPRKVTEFFKPMTVILEEIVCSTDSITSKDSVEKSDDDPVLLNTTFKCETNEFGENLTAKELLEKSTKVIDFTSMFSTNNSNTSVNSVDKFEEIDSVRDLTNSILDIAENKIQIEYKKNGETGGNVFNDNILIDDANLKSDDDNNLIKKNYVSDDESTKKILCKITDFIKPIEVISEEFFLYSTEATTSKDSLENIDDDQITTFKYETNEFNNNLTSKELFEKKVSTKVIDFTNMFSNTFSNSNDSEDSLDEFEKLESVSYITHLILDIVDNEIQTKYEKTCKVGSFFNKNIYIDDTHLKSDEDSNLLKKFSKTKQLSTHKETKTQLKANDILSIVNELDTSNCSIELKNANNVFEDKNLQNLTSKRKYDNTSNYCVINPDTDTNSFIKGLFVENFEKETERELNESDTIGSNLKATARKDFLDLDASKELLYETFAQGVNENESETINMAFIEDTNSPVSNEVLFCDEKKSSFGSTLKKPSVLSMSQTEHSGGIKYWMTFDDDNKTEQNKYSSRRGSRFKVDQIPSFLAFEKDKKSSVQTCSNKYSKDISRSPCNVNVTLSSESYGTASGDDGFDTSHLQSNSSYLDSMVTVLSCESDTSTSGKILLYNSNKANLTRRQHLSWPPYDMSLFYRILSKFRLSNSLDIDNINSSF